MLESRLCAQDQFGEPWYLDWCARIAEAPKMHRKQWEFCFISQALGERGLLSTGHRGLGFGVGQEPLAALFVSQGCSVVATDMDRAGAETRGWVSTGQHANSLEVLNDRGICSISEFNRLATFRTVDMNAIPTDLVDFDFVWSACSLEHLGSLERGVQFIYRAMDCLRPGGVAVHTTEYNLFSNDATFITPELVLYRRRDIEHIVKILREAGHHIEVDYSPGLGPADRYVDLPPYKSLPHLRLQIDSFVTTSLGLVIEKGKRVWPVSSAPVPSSQESKMDEVEARDTVQTVFRRVFGRPAYPEDEVKYSAALKGGLSKEGLISELRNSTEFVTSPANPEQLAKLAADITIDLAACEPHFGPLRFQGPSRDHLVFRGIIAMGGMWEPHVTAVLAQVLGSGDTLLDVGANIGYFTLIGAARVGALGQVVAFEPQTAARQYCEANIRLNGLDQARVHDYALRDSRSQRALWTPEEEMGGSFLIPEDKPQFNSFPAESVQCAALDDLIASGEVQLSACDVIKLDIQGSEPSALRGMRTLLGSTRPVLLLELHKACLELFDESPRSLLQILDELEYVPMLLPREDELAGFVDLPNISPWPDIDVRAAPTIDRLLEVIEELDRRFPPCYTADLLALPREADLRSGRIRGSRQKSAPELPLCADDPQKLRARVESLPWHHQIDLGKGIITPGRDHSSDKLQWLHLPEDLKGLSVLDVGAWDGFFSFEAERRGADRVLAIDSFVWQGRGPGSKQSFELARRVLGSQVQDLDLDVLDLSPAIISTFDLVLFLGVLYHMRHPLLALERVASVTAKHLILETHVDALVEERPVTVFYPGSELANDPTNWWGPNIPCVEAMLHAVGFRDVRLVYCSFDPALGEAKAQGPQSHRAVFHAFR